MDVTQIRTDWQKAKRKLPEGFSFPLGVNLGPNIDECSNFLKKKSPELGKAIENINSSMGLPIPKVEKLIKAELKKIAPISKDFSKRIKTINSGIKKYKKALDKASSKDKYSKEEKKNLGEVYDALDDIASKLSENVTRYNEGIKKSFDSGTKSFREATGITYLCR